MTNRDKTVLAAAVAVLLLLVLIFASEYLVQLSGQAPLAVVSRGVLHHVARPHDDLGDCRPARCEISPVADCDRTRVAVRSRWLGGCSQQ